MLSQADLDAIAAAQAKYPQLAANGISLLDVANQESASQSDPDTAVSSTGAVGLFQILPSTAEDPGYGVSSVDPSQLTDPTDNANFAASYLAGLLQNGNSGASAINAYSGGTYSLADIQSQDVSNTYIPGKDFNPNPGNPVGVYTQQSQYTGGNVTSFATGALAWVVEIAERGGIILIGGIILAIGLVFLFLDAKTIKKHYNSLGGIKSLGAKTAGALNG
jgi:hypothetical protein